MRALFKLLMKSYKGVVLPDEFFAFPASSPLSPFIKIHKLFDDKGEIVSAKWEKNFKNANPGRVGAGEPLYLIVSLISKFCLGYRVRALS